MTTSTMYRLSHADLPIAIRQAIDVQNKLRRHCKRLLSSSMTERPDAALIGKLSKRARRLARLYATLWPQLIAQGNGFELAHDTRPNLWATIDLNIESAPGVWLVVFDERGLIGHTSHATRSAALVEAVRHGYTTPDCGAMMRLMRLPTWRNWPGQPKASV